MMDSLEKMKKRMQLYNSVFAGNEEKCPICGEGILKGSAHHTYIKCTNPKCNYFVTFRTQEAVDMIRRG